jgi:hypothetical protein
MKNAASDSARLYLLDIGTRSIEQVDPCSDLRQLKVMPPLLSNGTVLRISLDHCSAAQDIFIPKQPRGQHHFSLIM